MTITSSYIRNILLKECTVQSVAMFVTQFTLLHRGFGKVCGRVIGREQVRLNYMYLWWKALGWSSSGLTMLILLTSGMGCLFSNR